MPQKGKKQVADTRCNVLICACTSLIHFMHLHNKDVIVLHWHVGNLFGPFCGIPGYLLSLLPSWFIIYYTAHVCTKCSTHVL